MKSLVFTFITMIFLLLINHFRLCLSQNCFLFIFLFFLFFSFSPHMFVGFSRSMCTSSSVIFPCILLYKRICHESRKPINSQCFIAVSKKHERRFNCVVENMGTRNDSKFFVHAHVYAYPVSFTLFFIIFVDKDFFLFSLHFFIL